MKRISVFIVFALLISFFATAKKKEIQTFRITQEERQRIDGFGASDAWSMWRAEKTWVQPTAKT